MMIIEDDRGESPEASETSNERVHPFLLNPLASELMDSLVTWATEEARGEPATEELARVRALVSQMLDNLNPQAQK